MLTCHGYAAVSADAPLAPYTFTRRAMGSGDVRLQVRYCGICHSDLHQVRNEWGGSLYPMVPGHEIVGTVTEVGATVTGFRVGDTVAVGCFVDSCRRCRQCQAGHEQYCEGHLVLTYNGTEADQKTPTYGGYSDQFVVDERYALRVPTSLPPDATAPLLCAGITTYSPLRHWGVGRGHRLGVVGLGGLGHMAVKFGAAFGAEVVVFSQSEKKREDAKRLGASDFVVTTDPIVFSRLARSFDAILDTVSAAHDLNAYLKLLRVDGTLILVGAPPKAVPLEAFSLIPYRRRLVGSMIGGIRETQEMLDFCAQHHVVSDIERIPIQQVNEAYERMLQGDVRYRFVIDLSTLRA